MRIVRAAMRSFALPLLRPIATSHGTLVARSGFLISVEDEAGRVAHGEATPFAAFGTEDLSRCEASLRQGLAMWLSQTDRGPASGAGGRVGPAASGQTSENPCARAALEAAWCDLSAQAEDQSLASWLRDKAGLAGGVSDDVAVQALIQGALPEEVASSGRGAAAAGFNTFKLKLGAHAERGALGLDLERVAALREAVGSAARLRLDANEAWTRAEAELALTQLAKFQIDFVEQPVAREALRDLAALDGYADIAVAADEALLGEGLSKVLDARATGVLIVKPSALGGISEALSLVAEARARGLRIVWSNLFEGVVGRATALALASATGEDGEVHGLGTAGLLALDLDESGQALSHEEARGGMIATAPLLKRARQVMPAWSRSSARSNMSAWSDEIWMAEG